MNEIAQLIHDKSGLSEDKSNEIATSVMGLIQSKVPPQFQSYLAPFLGSGPSGEATQPSAGESGGIGSMLGAASSIFGQHKE